MHGAFATPHTTVTHHLDLADDKGLVLMHGQIIPDGGVTAPEATWLVSCLQRFYDFDGQASGRKGELVRMFTQGDVENFKVEELLEESERLPVVSCPSLVLYVSPLPVWAVLIDRN